MISVVIADDHDGVRASFAAIIAANDGVEVVAEAGDGADALSAVRVHDPDVVLMDIRMPEMDGIEATRHLVASHVRTRIVLLTSYELDEEVYEGLRAGASGFLRKDVSPRRLTEAIRAAGAGDALVEPDVTRRLLEVYTRRIPADPAPLAALSPREIEILGLLAAGHSDAEIVRRLFLSDATVKHHVASLCAQLGARDRVQAVIIAYESGMVRSVGR